MSVKSFKRYIKIIDGEVLQLTTKFAENNLSTICLDYCDYKSDKYYEWTIGSSAYAVFFELPSVFDVQIQDIYNLLAVYCSDYCNKKGLTPDNFTSIFKKNFNKDIKVKES